LKNLWGRYPIPLKEGDVKELYAFNWLSLFMNIPPSILGYLKKPFQNKDFLKQKSGSWMGREKET